MNETSESVRRQAITDLSVVVERLDHVKETIEDYRHENREAHQAIMKKQDFTNGTVKKLQLWKAGLASVLAVMAMFSGYIISDYVSKNKAIAEGEKASLINQQNIQRNTENITKMEGMMMQILEEVKSAP